MPSTVTDVERSAMVSDKATADASTARQVHRRVMRFLPASPTKRYLCISTTFIVVGCLIAFMTLWFMAQPLRLSPSLKRLDYVWSSAGRPTDCWKSNGTVVAAAYPWIIQLKVTNPNFFQMIVEDMDVSVEFAGTKSSDRAFLARAEHMPYFNLLPDRKRTDGGWTYSRWTDRTFNLKALDALQWDVRDRAQAKALAAILVLCNVPVADLPPVLLNATSAADLPADPVARDAGVLTWMFAARQVRGLFGLSMTPAPGALTGDKPRPGSHGWYSPDIYMGVGERVADALCPETRWNSTVLDHIKQLVNVTNIAGQEVAKSG
ncbi:hypothetical protein GGF31_004072 [Allomyces arbusculus]|nr:hypothetical protein GGF31_004072 [Allomyces arbusculus]